MGDGETAPKVVDIGYGSYKGRPIVAVSMELLRRSDSVDAVYNIDEEFVFIGRAIVQKHVHEVQTDGAHLVLKVAARELYRVDEEEGKALLSVKREENLKAEAEREERQRLAQEEAAGVQRMDLKVGDGDETGTEG